jgi:hypothetical protein
MDSRAQTSSEADRRAVDRTPRTLLAVVGLALAIGPAVGVAAFGWFAAALMPVTPLGVMLLVLSAFYPRIVGDIRCGIFSVTVGREPSADGSAPARRTERASERSVRTGSATHAARRSFAAAGGTNSAGRSPEDD